MKRATLLTSFIAAASFIGFAGCNVPQSAGSFSKQGAQSGSKSITAVQVDESIDDIMFDSSIWGKAKSNIITLYPQTTIKVNDRKANKINSERYAKNVSVKSTLRRTYLSAENCMGR